MAQIINSKDYSLASDKECQDRRDSLIAAGIITPSSKGNIVNRRGLPPAVSTRENTKVLREDLIKRGFIMPVEEKVDGSTSYCELPRRRNYASSEEGEYKVRPIKSDEEYWRRRQVYFRAIQEILHARRELKLILDKKKESDPSWYF